MIVSVLPLLSDLDIFLVAGTPKGSPRVVDGQGVEGLEGNSGVDGGLGPVVDVGHGGHCRGSRREEGGLEKHLGQSVLSARRLLLNQERVARGG